MRKLRRVMFIKFARMFRGEKNVVPCIISNNTKIEGDIADGEIIHIDGRVVGNVSCKELIIGTSGCVCGDVNAKSVEIFGELNGSTKTDNLFIASSAKFVGDAEYSTIAIEPGAVLRGKYSNSEKAA